LIIAISFACQTFFGTYLTLVRLFISEISSWAGIWTSSWI